MNKFLKIFGSIVGVIFGIIVGGTIIISNLVPSDNEESDSSTLNCNYQ